MTIRDDGQGGPRSRLDAQLSLIMSGIPDVLDGLEGAAAHPADRPSPITLTTSTGIAASGS